MAAGSGIFIQRKSRDFLFSLFLTTQYFFFRLSCLFRGSAPRWTGLLRLLVSVAWLGGTRRETETVERDVLALPGEFDSQVCLGRSWSRR